MKKIILALTLITISASAIADNTKETWECKAFAGQWSDILVVAKSNKDSVLGSIEIAGTIHKATFKVVGLDREWGFGDAPNSKIDYVFKISPNGTAHYFDLAGAKGKEYTESSMTFKCRQKKQPDLTK